MLLASLSAKTSASSSSAPPQSLRLAETTAIEVSSSSAVGRVGAILPGVLGVWLERLLTCSANRFGVLRYFPPTDHLSTIVAVGDEDFAAAGLGCILPAVHGLGESGAGMRPVSQAPVGQAGNVVVQQKTNSKGGGSVPLLDAENSTRKLSANDNSVSGTAPASPSDSSNRTGSKTCCFCWCCCCSCSCITVTNAEETYPTRPIVEAPRDESPSQDEVKLWGESFDRVMQSSKGRKFFRDFLRTEFSEENVLFWLACEELKCETNPELVEEKARTIYDDYISILSPKEVSLDSRAREVINRNMVHPSPHTFDEAQLQIYTLMHRDSYPRFLNSVVYKRLVQ